MWINRRLCQHHPQLCPAPLGYVERTQPARVKAVNAARGPARPSRPLWHPSPITPRLSPGLDASANGFEGTLKSEGPLRRVPLQAAGKSGLAIGRQRDLGCSLRSLYFNSSSSRAGPFLWIRRFYSMVTVACVPPKGVGGWVFLWRPRMNNLARRNESVDNCQFVPEIHTGLSTGCGWCMKMGRAAVPPRAGGCGYGVAGDGSGRRCVRRAPGVRNAARSAIAGSSDPGWVS